VVVVVSSELVLTTYTNNCNSHPAFQFYNKEKGLYVPFHCGSWHCESCAPYKVEKVTGDLVRSAYTNNLTKHLTLTLDPKKIIGDPWAYINKVWAKMRVYLSRLSKKRRRRLKWQKVVQIQPQTGYPHYHIMLSEYIPFKWLKESWQALGGGSVYIRAVKIDNINGFVRGYFTKQVLGFDFPAYTRRYSSSQNIKLAKPKEAGWQIHRWVEVDNPNFDKKGYHKVVDRLDFLSEGLFLKQIDYGSHSLF